MKDFINKITRPNCKATDIIPIATLLAFMMAMFGVILAALISRLINFTAIFNFFTNDHDVSTFMFQYFQNFGVWIIFLLFVLIPVYNRKIFEAFRHNNIGNTFKMFLLGLLVGFIMNGICILMSVILKDIKLSFVGFDFINLLLFFISVLFQSGAEEIVSRCYLYQKLRRRYKSPIVAIIGTCSMFAGMHMFNNGITVIAMLQLFFVGLLTVLIVYYYGSLWMCIGIHTAWNYTQNILFGLPNSGVVSKYSLFKLEAATGKSGLFYDAVFGVEGSIGAMLILMTSCIIVYLLNKNKPEKRDLWKDNDIQKAES